MNLENEISAELKEMDSKLADMPRSMPFFRMAILLPFLRI
jgi:hypothetical protein